MQIRKVTVLLAAVLALSVAAGFASAQTFDYPDYGLRLLIPEGWVGQEVEAGLLLGSETVPGVVLITTNDAGSIEELKTTAKAGLIDGGTRLESAGDLEPVGSNGLAGEFSGTLDGVAARAFIVGLLNSAGTGVTIMAAAETTQYSSAHRAAALAVARGVEFYGVQASSEAEQWRKSFFNQRLAFHHSSYSSGGGSGYSGYQSSEEIFLCAPGYFVMKARESGSFDSGGAFGSLGGSQAGEGNWTVVNGEDGSIWLRLDFHDGSRREERIEMSGSKLLLNGSRYFYGPTDQCG